LSQQSKKAGEVSVADICSVKLDRLNRLKGMLCCGRPVPKEDPMDEINYIDVRTFPWCFSLEKTGEGERRTVRAFFATKPKGGHVGSA